MERLRHKYAGAARGGSTTDPAETCAPCAAGPAVCGSCQGGGVQSEAYGHRQLQRTCPSCGGEGVLLSGGAGDQPHNAHREPRAELLRSKLQAYEKVGEPPVASHPAVF